MVNTSPPSQKTKVYQDLSAILSQADFVPDAPAYALLTDLAFDEEVVPLLTYRIPIKNFPKDLAARLSQYMLRATSLSLLQTRSIVQINRRLLEIGIRPIWLKGVVLAHSIYDSPHLRPMADIDLLVLPEQYEQAIEAIMAMAYSPLVTELDLPTGNLAHHQHLVDKESGLVHLEIHRRLLGHSGNDFLPESYLRGWMQKASRFQIKGEDFYSLPAEAQFLYLCAHAFLQHGEAQLKLRRLVDLDLIIRKTQLDWSQLVDMAVELRWTYLLAHALVRIQATFQTPLPNAIIETIESRRPADENISLVQRLEGGDIRGEQVLRLLSQMSLSERLKMILQTACPPRSYMRSRYELAPEQAVWPYYFYRWGDQILGMLAALRKRLKTKTQL